MKYLLHGFVLLLGIIESARPDETSALARLEQSVSSPKSLRVTRDKQDGTVREIRVNAPHLHNDDLALFNEFPRLERLTISHAGYGGGKKTGVDFSGVKHLTDHPSLIYFSAGGAVGKPYLAALPNLTKVKELYIQTTNSRDEDWVPIGTMHHLTYLGIRVRNERMSKLTGMMFKHLMGLENLERFKLSEMTFRDDSTLFVTFITTRPKLRELVISRSNLPEASLARIREAKPDLEIVIQE